MTNEPYFMWKFCRLCAKAMLLTIFMLLCAGLLLAEDPAVELERNVSSLEKLIKSGVKTKSEVTTAFNDYKSISSSPKAGDKLKQLMKSDLTDCLIARHEAISKKMAGTPAKADEDKLKKLKEELNKRRKEALDAIFDLKAYPDEDHGAIGQPFVNKKIQEVKKIWDDSSKDYAVSTNESKDLLETGAIIETYLGLLGSPVKEEDKVVYLKPSVKLKDALINMTLNAEEKNIKKTNATIWETNETAVVLMSTNEMEVVRITNEYREMMGLRILGANDILYKAVRDHIAWCKSKGAIAHESDIPGKIKPSDRIFGAGYVGTTVGENLAAGVATAAAAVEGWINSSGHHRALVHKDFTEIGVSENGGFWGQNFGSAEPAVQYYPKKKSK